MQKGAVVRSRRLLSLSAVAIAALALVGCATTTPNTSASGGATPSATTAPTLPPVKPAANLCAAAAAPGETSKTIAVTDVKGKAPTIKVGAGAKAKYDVVERSVLRKGTGAEPKSGDYIRYAMAVYDTDGKEQASQGYGGSNIVPLPVDKDGQMAQFFGCATPGSRLAISVPAAQAGGQAPAIFVIDILEAIAPAQLCAVSDKPAPFPTVVMDAKKGPTVTIPAKQAAPTQLQMKTLKAGTGETVKPGAKVKVNYTGVKWSDGSVFDSSWQRGQTASFETTGVVEGFKSALENHKVGDTVMVVVPPQCGYGYSQTNNGLNSETLVFVVDILGVEK